MHIIRKTLENFSILFNKLFRKTKTQKNNIAILTFSLLDNDKIDVICSTPDISNKNPDEIADIAEKYAEFLLLINEGHLKNHILDIFNKSINNEDHNHKLLIDNIIMFWELLYNEYIKKQNYSIKANKPLIRPSQVFKITS